MEECFNSAMTDDELARTLQEQEELLFRSCAPRLHLQPLVVSPAEEESPISELQGEQEEEDGEEEGDGGERGRDEDVEEAAEEEAEEAEEEEEEEERRKTNWGETDGDSTRSTSRGRRRGRRSERNSAGETPTRINAAIRGSIARRRPLTTRVAESKSAFQQLLGQEEGLWEINDFSYENLCNLEEVKVACPVDILHRLPIRTFGEGDQRKGKYTECIICICNFNIGDRVKTLPCLHVFHETCIDEWLRHKNTCPVDKIRVSE